MKKDVASSNGRTESARTISRLIKTFLLPALLFPLFSHAGTLKPEDIYQKIVPSVMTLHVRNIRGENYVGSAFLALDKNLAVTAWHVLSDATNVVAKFSNGSEVEVDGLVDKDEQHDLALIRLSASGRPRASFGLSAPQIGSRAYVIGAPKGFDFSISDGLVSQIQRIRGFDQYQLSCPVSGGNSGGPVVNDHGQVIGVTAWTQKDAQNLNFATPAVFIHGLNPKHTLTSWAIVGQASIQPTSALHEVVKGSVAEDDVSGLKRVLKDSAGERITITVSRGGGEEKFDVILPQNFVR